MRTLSQPCRSFVSGLAALVGTWAMAAPPERTLTVDPVELIAGHEVSGKPELAIEHEGIEYRFASPESKAAFEKEPAKYEVADGGACGAMGPLSGMGDARRYVVHDDRIYFFASDQCRGTFLKDPSIRIETDDPIPTGTQEQAAAGRRALDRVVTWGGGAERLRGIATYRAMASRKETTSEKEWTVTNEVAIGFPDRYFTKETWNETWFATIRGPEGAAMASQRGHDVIASSRRRAFDRSMARWPVVILRAYADGAADGRSPGLVVVGDGEGTVADVPVEFVKVAMNGAASRMAIEKSSGRLVQLAFHGRDTTSSVGESVRTFTKYATVEGVTLPVAYTVNFDGKEIAKAGVALEAFEVNPELPADLFKVMK